MADASSAVYHTVANILEGAKGFRRARQEHPDQDVSPFLLLVLVSAEELVLFILPDPDPAEFHGANPEMLGPGRQSLTFGHRQRPEWDFGAWFGEKASSLRQAARDLAKLWLESRQAPSDQIQDRRSEQMEQLLVTVDAYARLIFDQITDNDLVIETAPEEEV